VIDGLLQAALHFLGMMARIAFGYGGHDMLPGLSGPLPSGPAEVDCRFELTPIHSGSDNESRV
jgi:hypothetical protein